MSTLAVLGCMWGDEAKAKIVDYLGDLADYVVRFQGGSNAGHTIHHAGQKYVFHTVPAGILYPKTRCIIAAGVVVDPYSLISEINSLREMGIDFADRLFIDERAGIVLPMHKDRDLKAESRLGEGKIGTTGRGIGPAYSDLTARMGLRIGDLAYPDWVRDRLIKLYEHHNISLNEGQLGEVIDSLAQVWDYLSPFVTRADIMIREAYLADKYILFEGAQGTLLDVSYGTYPFVTSSHTIAGGISCGCGISPKMVDKTIGVYKAYSTRVGEGPFPTELFDELGDWIRIQGNEFGSTTGRPRRVGWFDAVAASYTAQLNGLDSIAVTLLDVLSGIETLQICTGYWIGDTKLSVFPSHPLELERVTPEYLTLKGWEEDITECRKLAKLPKNAREYLEVIQDLVERPIDLVSVGKDRSQTINLRSGN